MLSLQLMLTNCQNLLKRVLLLLLIIMHTMHMQAGWMHTAQLPDCMLW
jgi:hypothetical protein